MSANLPILPPITTMLDSSSDDEELLEPTPSVPVVTQPQLEVMERWPQMTTLMRDHSSIRLNTKTMLYSTKK